MKFNASFRALGLVLSGIVKGESREVRRRVRQEYRAIILRAGDIGGKNRLLGSYALAAFFIAMNRNTGRSPEENYHNMEQWVRTSTLYRCFMGSGKQYFSEKNMAQRRVWSAQTHQKKYKNDWVVDVLEKTDDYEFGFDYLECGVCKLCRDEGCPELAQYLCRLDFITVELMGIGLQRTTTLAEGGDRCDFRFIRKD